MREDKGLSMRQLGKIIGVSDSYIAHLENGRMDFPTDKEKLERLIKPFGIKTKSFFERVRLYKHRTTPKEELLEIIEGANEDTVKTLLGITKSLTQ